MNILICIFFGIFIFTLLFLLLRPHALENEKMKKRLHDIANIDSSKPILDDELSKPFSERFFKPIFDSFLSKINKLIPESRKRDIESSTKTSRIQKRIYQAGLKTDLIEYRTIQFIVISVATVLSAIITFSVTPQIIVTFLGALIGAYIGYAIFRFEIARRITKRNELMRRQFPEILDMLSVSVEAGMGLEQAIYNIINNYKGPLVDELDITYREMRLGRSRRDALFQLGERIDMDEVKTFTRAIIQAGEMGVSIKNVLRSQATYMRQTRRNKIEERAMKVPIKILIPMVLFIFPVIFIVLLAPAIFTIIEHMN